MIRQKRQAVCWAAAKGLDSSCSKSRWKGRKRMPAEAFLNGQHLTDNEMLGEMLQ